MKRKVFSSQLIGEFITDFMKNETVSGMIFDVDGTILDSMPVWNHCARRYLTVRDVSPKADLEKTLLSMTMQQGAQYIKKTYGLQESFDEIISGMNQTVATAYQMEIQLKPNILPFLDALKNKKIPMTVVTSTDRPLILAAFRRLGILRYFDSMITCSEFGSGKDCPEIFYAAADRMGSRPDDTWVAEDALYAIRTARAAGFKVIGAADASGSSDEDNIRSLADYFVSFG